jgi:hypothetical protein
MVPLSLSFWLNCEIRHRYFVETAKVAVVLLWVVGLHCDE